MGNQAEILQSLELRLQWHLEAERWPIIFWHCNLKIGSGINILINDYKYQMRKASAVACLIDDDTFARYALFSEGFQQPS